MFQATSRLFQGFNVSRVQKIETAQRETLKLFNIAKGDYFLFGNSRP
jgi:hypothetical protein